ncbi:tripartite tricarboxylate transporter permease [Enterocloster lavalensis]|uniref:tripartite tricarboxylate transporter permease n=1 Tax=Enterocloster lavalensis TaxID=460384 RepID=UPI000D1B055F|nr:tripartite tricarboxylate transporter permease [Enterocloster lavalensis]PST34416.1 C4-dicarboxylate ABC transporter permease [Enterocloster lavalensis]
MQVLSYAFSYLTNPVCMLFCFAGTFMGLTFGTLPGLTATMGIALLIPLSYGMDPVTALGMMIGCYVGGIAGGAVSSILLNIPGTPSAIVTAWDGYPMMKQDRGAQAMGWAACASGFGGLFSWGILCFFSPYLAKLCVNFSCTEYAALAFLGLMMISSVTGDNVFKGIIAALFGIFLSMVGVDIEWGDLRFTFGSYNLMGGINLLPVMVGLYSLPQILKVCNDPDVERTVKIKLSNFLPKAREFFKYKWTLLRTSVLGTLIGIIPATGANVACFLSYDLTKRFSKHPDTFGKGDVEGVITSECANNAVCGGAMVPLLTLGIPGDGVTAILLGGLMIHDIQPGPSMYLEQYPIIIGIFTCMLVCTLMMVLIQMVGIKFFIRLLSVPNDLLVPGIAVMMTIGSFAMRNNLFDVGICLVLGSLSYFMGKAGYPIAPAVLGLVLGGTFEKELRTAMVLSGYNPFVFLTNPVSCVFVVTGIAFAAWSAVRSMRKKQ